MGGGQRVKKTQKELEEGEVKDVIVFYFYVCDTTK